MLSLSARLSQQAIRSVTNLYTTTAGQAAIFRQVRPYQCTSIPDADMTQYKPGKNKKEGVLGCYLPDEEFEKCYQNTLRRLGVPLELDLKTTRLIDQEMLGKYAEIKDIHNQIKSTKEDIRAPIKPVGWTKDAPTHIIWPAQYSDPVASKGGLIRNTLYASLTSEIERNLTFLESFADQIDEGEGEIASVVQYYVGRGSPIPFRALNFLLEQRLGKKLSDKDLKDEQKVRDLVSEYIDRILPGAAKEFKIDTKKQQISARQVLSPHSSIQVRFKLNDGQVGIMSGEVGRPNSTFIGDKLVHNAHEQVVDAAVFQSMNWPRIRNLPDTLEGFKDLKQPYQVTKKNFYKPASRLSFEALKDPNKPINPSINLVDCEDEKGNPIHLSDGVPVSVISHKVPFAGRLAKVLYFLTGERPWDALRFGGYFAHDAQTGQSRACESLVVFGNDLAGGDIHDLLPVLSGLEQYDLSQTMRESVYENILFAELHGSDQQDSNHSIFSETTAEAYLRLSCNAFVTMRIYEDLLKAADNRISSTNLPHESDEEAEFSRTFVLNETLNFKRRYSHMWAIASYIMISLHKSQGAKVFLDHAGDSISAIQSNKSQAPTSGTLTFLKQFILEKHKAVQPTLNQGTTRDQSVAANTFDLTSRSLEYLAKINAELGIKGN